MAVLRRGVPRGEGDVVGEEQVRDEEVQLHLHQLFSWTHPSTYKLKNIYTFHMHIHVNM